MVLALAEFANHRMNPQYAQHMGLTPVMADNLLAVVLDSAALDMSLTNRSQSPDAFADWL